METRNIVQQRVIEFLVQLPARPLKLGEVGDKSIRRLLLPAQGDLDSKRVAMYAAVTVAARHGIEVMRRIEAEATADFELACVRYGFGRGLALHGMPIILCVCSDKRQRGCALQYATAICVYSTRLGQSMGCNKKYLKTKA